MRLVEVLWHRPYRWGYRVGLRICGLERTDGPIQRSVEQESSGGGLPSTGRQEPRGSASSSAERHMDGARSAAPAERISYYGAGPDPLPIPEQSYIVGLYGLDGKREHWMPGNRRKGTGPREKRPFDTQAEARAFADASNFPQGEVYQCSICGKWHLAKPRRR